MTRSRLSGRMRLLSGEGFDSVLLSTARSDESVLTSPISSDCFGVGSVLTGAFVAGGGGMFMITGGKRPLVLSVSLVAAVSFATVVRIGSFAVSGVGDGDGFDNSGVGVGEGSWVTSGDSSGVGVTFTSSIDGFEVSTGVGAGVGDGSGVGVETGSSTTGFEVSTADGVGIGSADGLTPS